MKKRIRVLVADDHAVLRAGLRMLIDAQRDMVVVAEADSGDAAIPLTRKAAPHVAIVDITMPGPGLDATVAGVLQACRRTRVLVLTMHDDPAYQRAAMLAGAAGYVVKKAADTELISAIRAVAAGRTFLDLTHAGVPAPAAGRQLSARERAVLRLLARGHTNAQIAAQLKLSTKTVETYRARLYRKLNVKGRVALFEAAVEAGLLGDASRSFKA